MPKVPLILQKDEFTSFTSYYLESLWNDFFDIQIYNENNTYDKARSLFAVWCHQANDLHILKLKEKGYKIVIDNLWESATGRSDFYWIENSKWWWWNESLWWHALGFSNYTPKKDWQYLALMQLRRYKPERGQIISTLAPLLQSMMYSCAWADVELPDDNHDPQQGQRYMHPSWYDQTYCSVVVETSVSEGQMLFVTEKSFKPLAYFHPFLSVSQPGTLDWIRSLGFETFDNLFDESYDTVDGLHSRLDIILANLRTIDLSAKDYDAMTTQKIQHNHELFFSGDRCRQGIIKEIIEPLLDYAET